MNALTRYEIRQQVRQVLRSDSYPREDINSAINRVIADINSSGRYRFHRTYTSLALVADTFEYTVDSTLLSDYALVFAPGVTTKQKIINKGSELIDPYSLGKFIETGDAPTEYWRFGQKFLFDPVPNAVAAAQTVRILGEFDLSLLSGDFDTSGLPNRYHINLLAYGAAAQLAPDALVRSGASGPITVQDAFNESFKSMIRQEKWEPYQTEEWMRDSQFLGSEEWGNVDTIR